MVGGFQCWDYDVHDHDDFYLQKTWGSATGSTESLVAYQATLNGEPNDEQAKLQRKGNTVAKLRDSLSKLREHLDSLQKKRSQSIATESEVKSVLNGLTGFEPLQKKSHSQSELPTFTLSDIKDQTFGIPSPEPDILDPSSFIPVIDISEDNPENIENPKANAQKMDYDTGDTSMNESDAGSISFRGTNDSAYASDRTSSHSSQHRRRRKDSFVDSEQSSPET